MTRRLTFVALWAALAAPVAAEPSIRKVPVQPPVTVDEPRGLAALFTRKSRRACIESSRVAAATVTSDRTIDLVLVGGERWRMRFKEDCPALSYYQGFYYRQTQAGRLCAGRDAIKARSGAECPIASLAPIKARKERK